MQRKSFFVSDSSIGVVGVFFGQFCFGQIFLTVMTRNASNDAFNGDDFFVDLNFRLEFFLFGFNSIKTDLKKKYKNQI